MAYRRYTDEDKAVALAVLTANGGNLKRTARQLGVPRRTLSHWAAGRHIDPQVTQIAHQKRAELADKLEEIALKLLAGVSSKIGDADLQQRMICLGICIDKMLQLGR